MSRSVTIVLAFDGDGLTVEELSQDPNGLLESIDTLWRTIETQAELRVLGC